MKKFFWIAAAGLVALSIAGASFVAYQRNEATEKERVAKLYKGAVLPISVTEAETAFLVVAPELKNIAARQKAQVTGILCKYVIFDLGGLETCSFNEKVVTLAFIHEGKPLSSQELVRAAQIVAAPLGGLSDKEDEPANIGDMKTYYESTFKNGQQGLMRWYRAGNYWLLIAKDDNSQTINVYPDTPTLKDADPTIQSVRRSGDLLLVKTYWTSNKSETSYIDEAALLTKKIGLAFKSGVPDIQGVSRIAVQYDTSIKDRLGNTSRGKAFALLFRAKDFREARWENLTNEQSLDLAVEGAFSPPGRTASVLWCGEHKGVYANFCRVVLAGQDLK